ncbi:hypothetical protein [Methylobacterium oxalidis]|uniref:hypothetical protein n=1 Tax=Methylobacterium oxalidis TaxID=944322 RepID=UPI00331473A6
MYFDGLKKAEKRKLEAEVVSNDARLRLTRLMRSRCAARASEIELIRRNQFVNIGRTVLGLPIHRLEPDDWGTYADEEFGWHNAELELVMRRPDTAQLVEVLGDMLQQDMLPIARVNAILADDNVSVRFETRGDEDDIGVRLLAADELGEEEPEPEHPNVRLLVERMEAAFEHRDYAGVLHASATVFETLAKLVFGDPTVETQSLGGFIAGYRKRSLLPETLLDFIQDTYNRRNREPLAGHGATRPPSVKAADAAVLVEMTKTCVRLERRLARPEIGDEEPSPRASQAASRRGARPSPPKKAPARKPTSNRRAKPRAAE